MTRQDHIVTKPHRDKKITLKVFKATINHMAYARKYIALLWRKCIVLNKTSSGVPETILGHFYSSYPKATEVDKDCI